MKFIIDTDVGIDDAIALLMVLAHPQAQIEAITTVMGNVSLEQASHNAGLILDIANIAYESPIPIYKGCTLPLLRHQPDYATHMHGPDGLGGLGGAETKHTVEAEHAALALIRLSQHLSGELTLLALGPLSNIALAIRLAPSFLTHVKRLVVMGGAVDAQGNASASAEFNVWADPEAAKIVFDACSASKLQVELISWEATLTHAVPLVTWKELIRGHSAAAQLVQGMTDFFVQQFNLDIVLWPDPLAAAVALEPDIILNEESRFVTVETGHSLSRGQTIVDYRYNCDKTPNTRIIREVDQQKFHDLLKLAPLGS